MSRLRTFARAMRHEPTRAEGRVWSWLRARRFGGWKFRRQQPVAGYIVDFYCDELKLAVELDGRHHEAEWMVDYESDRTRKLAAAGVEIVRIANEVLIRDALMAAEIINAAIAARAESRSRRPTP